VIDFEMLYKEEITGSIINISYREVARMISIEGLMSTLLILKPSQFV
jgi:hypothetical protein